MTTEDSLSEEEQLKRYLLRVSYSGMGVNSTLDRQLNELRTAIKDQTSTEDLKIYVDNITDFLREQEELIEDQLQSSDSPALQALLAEVENLPLSRKSKKLLKTLNKKRQQLNPESIFEEIGNILKTTEINESNSRWNPFNKKKREHNEEVLDNDEVLEKPAVSQQVIIPQALKDALNNFVDQLGNIDIYRKASENIKDQLLAINHYEQLSDLIEQIASALLEAANQEHVQFENFLQKLNKRLLNVASYLNQAAVGHESLISDTQKLDTDLTGAIADIQQEIADSPNLGPLKSRLLSSFEHIFNSVNHFKETQKNKVKASLAELKIVREQLAVTEEEAERLKTNLKEQRFKAYNDPLTSLPNRYAYNERLTQEYSRWRRYRNSLSLAVCDIDYFKKINDQYGHQAGDEVLKAVANQLDHGLRESDFIARYGGEEFVILMPETRLADATKAINKLRLMVRDHAIKVTPNQTINITLSFGVAEFEGADTATDVFNKADKALYRAKEKGRNQVCAERSIKPDLP
ncbi:GGDEF domain-containing protein [Pleionea litopenaei]|uniref:diguanylate cyclase n=1 Tax=Pleionea litopenaei TaxID=3070815 RepID=A0AA51RRE1_9GAMM|nr:GGDEF domain-containing protein [Pleionea sp. HL-JVS1]WMS86162.1 GGDEF domain-containing protein [Pleionea sp. HL-JVS1]